VTILLLTSLAVAQKKVVTAGPFSTGAL